MPLTPVPLGTSPNDGSGIDLRQAFANLNQSDTWLKSYIESLVSQEVTDRQLADSALTLLISARASLNSPNFSGEPTAPTPDTDDSSARISTTEFVATAIQNAVALVSLARSQGDAALQSQITALIGAFAPIDSPVFEGDPQAPTPDLSDDSGSLANTAFVQALVASIVGVEAQARQQGLASLQAQVTGIGEEYAPIDSPVFTGDPQAPTPELDNSSGSLATTEFVQVLAALLVATETQSRQQAVASLQSQVTEIGDTRAPIDSPVFTGEPQAPTPGLEDNSGTIANTEFVQTLAALLIAAETLARQQAVASLQAQVTGIGEEYAPLDSPVFEGNPQAPTPDLDDDSGTIANTEFVRALAVMLIAAETLARQQALSALQAQVTEIDETRAPIASPVFTGEPQAPTPSLSSDSGDLATTEFVHSLVSLLLSAEVLVLNQTDDSLQEQISALAVSKAPLASPALSGEPTAPTPDSLDSSGRLATTEFVQNVVDIEEANRQNQDDLIWDELNRLDDVKAPLDSPVLFGDPRAPTPVAGDSSTSISTTEFVTTGLTLERQARIGTDNYLQVQIQELAADILSRAPSASPVFTGDPRAPTPPEGDDDESIATTEFVARALESQLSDIDELIDAIAASLIAESQTRASEDQAIRDDLSAEEAARIARDLLFSTEIQQVSEASGSVSAILQSSGMEPLPENNLGAVVAIANADADVLWAVLRDGSLIEGPTRSEVLYRNNLGLVTGLVDVLDNVMWGIDEFGTEYLGTSRSEVATPNTLDILHGVATEDDDVLWGLDKFGGEWVAGSYSEPLGDNNLELVHAYLNSLDTLMWGLDKFGGVWSAGAYDQELGLNNLGLVAGIVNFRDDVLWGLDQFGGEWLGGSFSEPAGENNLGLVWGVADSEGNVALGVTETGQVIGSIEVDIRSNDIGAIVWETGGEVYGLLGDTEIQITDGGSDTLPRVVGDKVHFVRNGPMGTPTTFVAPYEPDAEAHVFWGTNRKFEGVIATGQSLMVGPNPAVMTNPLHPDRAFKFQNGPVGAAGTPTVNILEPLAEKESNETYSSAFANWLLENTDVDRTLLMMGQAQGGQAYDTIKKGTPLYNANMTQFGYAQGLSGGFHVRGLVVIHGEQDGLNSNPVYDLDLGEWLDNYNEDVRALNNQRDRFFMFFSQTSSQAGYEPLATRAQFTTPFLQLKAALNRKDLILTGTKYHLTYLDHTHIDQLSTDVHGDEIAKVYHRVVDLGEEWLPLCPVGVSVAGSVTRFTMHVPRGPMVINTTRVTDPGDYGFNLVDGSGNVISGAISSVALDGDDVVVTLVSPAPAGYRLGYAFYNGTFGTSGWDTGARGCICDSDDAISEANGLPMLNWCVSFEHVYS